MESHNASIKLPESKDAGEQAPKEEAAYSEVMLASKIEEVRAFRELVFDKKIGKEGDSALHYSSIIASDNAVKSREKEEKKRILEEQKIAREKKKEAREEQKIAREKKKEEEKKIAREKKKEAREEQKIAREKKKEAR